MGGERAGEEDARRKWGNLILVHLPRQTPWRGRGLFGNVALTWL